MRQPVRRDVEFTIAHAVLAANHGDRFRRAPGLGFEKLRQRQMLSG